MKFNMKLFIFLFLISTTFSGYAEMTTQKKIIYGYVEKATLVDKNLVLSAKLDTGAKSSSLSAVDIQEFEENGKTYLRFIVPSKQGDVAFISEYLGKVRIKVRAGENRHSELAPIKRPVVLMKIKIGDKEHVIPVNLTNRQRFIYPLLLGRDAINAFSGLIDPSTAFTIKSNKS